QRFSERPGAGTCVITMRASQLDEHANCLIGETNGEAQFWQICPSVLPTTSRAELQARLDAGSVSLSSDVLPTLTLASLLKRYLPGRSIDLMSVDVEGIDTMVARQIVELPTGLRPHMLCVESNSPNSEQLRKILGPAYGQVCQVDVVACNLIFWKAH